MLDIKPINTSAIPYQFESMPINHTSSQTNVGASLTASPMNQCHHPFIDNLLNGFTSIILQTVSSLFQQIGLGGSANNTVGSNNSLIRDGQGIVEKPSIIEEGIDFISGIFGGKLNSIFDIFKGEGSFLGKAKDLIGKLF